MNRTRRCRFGWLTLVAALVTPGVCLGSHPYHVSNAEINWNPRSGNFEVALCVWPADLEKALAKDQQRVIDLDQVADLDKLIHNYVQKKFLIRPVVAEDSGDANSRQKKSGPMQPEVASIRWVGHEHDLKTAWLYFEVEGGKQGGQWTFENRLFFEFNSDQLNHVEVTVGDSTKTFVCRRNDANHLVDTSP